MSPARSEFGIYLRDALADCASRFHELLFLAAFWNPSVSLYIDLDSGAVLPREASDAVARLHALVFEQWLGLSMAEQFAEFTAYLVTLDAQARRTFLQFMRCPDAQAALIPPGAGPEQRDLFLLDLTTLEVLAAGG
jgi:hypothetical protein